MWHCIFMDLLFLGIPLTLLPHPKTPSLCSYHRFL
uniref:Uncharacterized protein n=1 Tax=Rhizophora mucronata TaxID=61149 RepID=A0A2P2P1K0_RHIMU